MDLESLPQRNTTMSCNLAVFITPADNTLAYILLCLAAAVIFVYCFLQKRLRKCCGADRPSLFIPINLIQSTPERWVYVLIFGSLSGDLLLFIVSNGFGFTEYANTNLIGATLNTILLMFLVSFIYYPVFASVRGPIPILGYIIGFIYSTILFFESYLRIGTALYGCIQLNNYVSDVTTYIILVALMPVILSHLSVLLWYSWKVIYEVYRLIKSQNPRLAVFELPREYNYPNRIKWLLSKWKVDPSSKNDNIHEITEQETGKYRKKWYYIQYRLKKYLYKYDPNIHYPLRFLAAVVVMVYITYILTLTVTSVGFIYVIPLVDVVKNASSEVQGLIEIIEDTNIDISLNITRAISTVYDIVLVTTYGLAVIIPTGPLFSFLACMVLLVHMMASVHIHLKKMSLGNYDFLPDKLASPTYRLVHSMQYIGFQIGYFTWAWILLTLSVWLIGLVVLMAYFLFKFFLDIVIRIFLFLILPLIYSYIIYYFQLIFTKFFFVGDTNNKHVVIKNLRLFHWFSYILVFQNAVVGITSAFIRILYSIMFGILLLFRLDRVVLMKGFEQFDKGHKSYIGFLYLEHTLNNPVLRVFTDILLEGHGRRKTVKERAFRDKSTPLSLTQVEDWIDEPCKEVVTYPRTSQQALNRWMVAYTLIHNVDLVQFTATQLELKLKKHHRRHIFESELGDDDDDDGEEEDSVENQVEREPVYIEVQEEAVHAAVDDPAVDNPAVDDPVHAAVDELPEASIATFVTREVKDNSNVTESV